VKLRVSDGTASMLGLSRGRLDAPLKTAYFMTYSTLAGGKCLADCSFCALASSSSSSPEYLSRVRWRPYEMEVVMEALSKREGDLKRACLQVVNYPGYLHDALEIVDSLGRTLPVSVSIMPVGRDNFARLKERGADKVTVPMDAATPALFEKHKGKRGFYAWERHTASIGQALEAFGRSNVFTYLIVGLGESDEEAVSFMEDFREMGVNVALHSFTSVPGLDIEGAGTPTLERSRGIQLARYLIFEKGATACNFEFREGGLERIVGVPGLTAIAEGEEPYLTTGCPDCNRPFYTERVRGPLFNIPKLSGGDAH
jgi:biotin synthase-related radical SAM superfamily protein